MPNPNESIKNLQRYFIKLPGVGQKTANRYIEKLLNLPQTDLETISSLIKNLKNYLHKCSTCNLTHINQKCPICNDKTRDPSKILILKTSSDVKNFEKTKEWNSLYHVLGDTLNPIKNIKPENIDAFKLVQRIKNNQGIQEIVIGINFDPSGDLTALHIKQALKPYNVKISRLARGLPSGADLEYLDEDTLKSALKNRN